jgi:hypothetical protein
MEDYRVKLIQIAYDIATATTNGSVAAGDEARFLRRFRTVYQHLAVSVETTGGGVEPNPMMGMDPFGRTPTQVTDLLERSDANLNELDR